MIEPLKVSWYRFWRKISPKKSWFSHQNPHINYKHPDFKDLLQSTFTYVERVLELVPWIERKASSIVQAVETNRLRNDGILMDISEKFDYWRDPNKFNFGLQIYNFDLYDFFGIKYILDLLETNPQALDLLLATGRNLETFKLVGLEIFKTADNEALSSIAQVRWLNNEVLKYILDYRNRGLENIRIENFWFWTADEIRKLPLVSVQKIGYENLNSFAKNQYDTRHEWQKPVRYILK